MKQSLVVSPDKRINQDKLTFIRFSSPVGAYPDKRINPFRVYPVSGSRFAVSA